MYAKLENIYVYKLRKRIYIYMVVLRQKYLYIYKLRKRQTDISILHISRTTEQRDKHTPYNPSE